MRGVAVGRGPGQAHGAAAAVPSSGRERYRCNTSLLCLLLRVMKVAVSHNKQGR